MEFFLLLKSRNKDKIIVLDSIMCDNVEQAEEEFNRRNDYTRIIDKWEIVITKTTEYISVIEEHGEVI